MIRRLVAAVAAAVLGSAGAAGFVYLHQSPPHRSAVYLHQVQPRKVYLHQ